MEKLPIEIKTKWLEALRSGEYKQGAERLYTEETDTYCCLGVLNKVCNLESCSTVYLRGNKVPNMLNLDVTPDITLTTILTNMNDAQGKSFNEIADWIEENL
jgi:hypothetical protein